jgi:hypothetical protein
MQFHVRLVPSELRLMLCIPLNRKAFSHRRIRVGVR